MSEDKKTIFKKVGDGVADGEVLEVGPSDARAGSVLVNMIVFGGACAIVTVVVDDAGDEVGTVQIDSFDATDAPGISQSNGIALTNGMKVRIKNTSGSPNDFVATGEALG